MLRSGGSLTKIGQALRYARPSDLDRTARPRPADAGLPNRAARHRTHPAEHQRCSPRPGPHVSCLGKGRKQRITPLTTATVAVLRAWLTERGGRPADPLFPTRRRTAMTLDALQRRVTLHAATAAMSCPTLQEKTITPHILRHSCAMALLRAGIDISVIALWMGHENLATVQHYIHADLALKEQALARTKPADAPSGRYQPPDTVLALLDSLTIMPTSSS
jgi:integrase